MTPAADPIFVAALAIVQRIALAKDGGRLVGCETSFDLSSNQNGSTIRAKGANFLKASKLSAERAMG
ncbi:hypothetical protein NSU_3741 [Novosphingobium pentaromativorans US6-1]|uniref:Uncharacterized protein n=1 Tax=Novosphingobium pentaromativorans US6-1 TaxID=1088721 RepID=G6EHC0_9SPHN|nr:hypothetical protein NSU_3741 [Novosphingobium pentaromativorans US6-1]